MNMLALKALCLRLRDANRQAKLYYSGAVPWVVSEVEESRLKDVCNK